MKKKAIELSMNTIIIAAILLVVLIVILAIFTGSMNDIADKFSQHTDKAGEKSDEALNNIGIFSCSDGQLKCQNNNLYICNDKEWEIKKECEDGCSNNACK